jgi:hypothetical protein
MAQNNSLAFPSPGAFLGDTVRLCQSHTKKCLYYRRILSLVKTVDRPASDKDSRIFGLFKEKRAVLLESKKEKKRPVGIEPTLTAWKAVVLPLNYERLKGT